MASGWKTAALATVLAAAAQAQEFDSASRSGIRPTVALEKPSIMRMAANSEAPQTPTHTMIGAFGEFESRFAMTNVSDDPVYIKLQMRSSGQYIDGNLGPGQQVWAEDLAYDLGLWGQGMEPIDFYVGSPDKVVFESKLIKYGYTQPMGTAGMTTGTIKESDAVGDSQLFAFQLPDRGTARLFLQSFPGLDAQVGLNASRPGIDEELARADVPAGTIVDVALPQARGAIGVGHNSGGRVQGFSAVENTIGDMYGSRLATRYEAGAVIPGVKNHVPISRGNHSYDVDLNTVITLGRVLGGDAAVTLTSHFADGTSKSAKALVPAYGLYTDDTLLAKLGIENGKTAAVTVSCDDGIPCAVINAHTEVRAAPGAPRGRVRAVRGYGPRFTRAEENPILRLEDYVDPSRKSVIGNAGNWRGAETIIGIYAQERTKADVEVYWEGGDYLGKFTVDLPAGTYKEFRLGDVNTACLPEFSYGRVEVKPLSGKAYVGSWRMDKGSRDSWNSDGTILPNDGPTKKEPASGWECAF